MVCVVAEMLKIFFLGFLRDKLPTEGVQHYLMNCVERKVVVQ